MQEVVVVADWNLPGVHSMQAVAPGESELACLPAGQAEQVSCSEGVTPSSVMNLQAAQGMHAVEAAVEVK